MAFELTERHKNALKRAVEDLRSEERKGLGGASLDVCREDCATNCDPDTADRLIRDYLSTIEVTPVELGEWLKTK